MPRLYHKKSRNGCSRCRARRVKCDEARPVCNNCNRHRVPCLYEKTTPNSSSSPSQHGTPHDPEEPRPDLLSEYRPSAALYKVPNLDESAQETMHSSDFSECTAPEVPESRSRRLLELRLLQNYIDEASRTFGACHLENVRHAWSNEIPRLGLKHDNLLYQIFSMSALHLLRSDPDNSELILARETYKSMALHEHRREVARLSSKNADAVACASSMIFMDAFASLHNREMHPYAPPMEWLRLARGAGSVFAVGLQALKASNAFDTSTIMAVANGDRYFFDDGRSPFEERHRKDLLVLLTQNISSENWDNETQEAYEKTLSYIGWVQHVIDDGEHILAVCRRMMAFAVLAPKRFIDLVEEKRPRALVILAHFLALGSQMGDIWWIGKTIEREIQGIQRVLPPEWQSSMRLPLDMVGLAHIKEL